MARFLRYDCPCCPGRHEIEISRWTGKPVRASWQCPSCSETLEIRHSLARLILRFVLRAGVLLGILSFQLIRGDFWFLLFVTTLAFLGIEKLLGSSRIAVKAPSRDFLAEELKPARSTVP